MRGWHGEPQRAVFTGMHGEMMLEVVAGEGVCDPHPYFKSVGSV